MRFVDTKFIIGNNVCYGNPVVSLFKITNSREMKGFIIVFNSFKVFVVEFGLLDVGLVAVVLVYDVPDAGELDTHKR